MIVNRITRLWRRLKHSWHPKPLDMPVVDPEFPELSDLQRAGESFRYSVLSLEFWLTPHGGIREWIRHNTILAVVLAPVVLVLIPLIGCGLAGIAAWCVALTAIAAHAVIIPLLVVGAVLAILFALKFLKSL